MPTDRIVLLKKFKMFTPPFREQDLCTLGNDIGSRSFITALCQRRTAEVPKFRPKRPTRSSKSAFTVQAVQKREIMDDDGSLNDDAVFDVGDQSLSEAEIAPLIEQMRNLSIDRYEPLDDSKNSKTTDEERNNEYGEFIEENDFPEEREEFEDITRREERERHMSERMQLRIQKRREREVDEIMDRAVDVERAMAWQRQIEEQKKLNEDQQKIVEELLQNFKM